VTGFGRKPEPLQRQHGITQYSAAFGIQLSEIELRLDMPLFRRYFILVGRQPEVLGHSGTGQIHTRDRGLCIRITSVGKRLPVFQRHPIVSTIEGLKTCRKISQCRPDRK
jgi:hypothetical protein